MQVDHIAGGYRWRMIGWGIRLTIFTDRTSSSGCLGVLEELEARHSMLWSRCSGMVEV